MTCDPLQSFTHGRLTTVSGHLFRFSSALGTKAGGTSVTEAMQRVASWTTLVMAAAAGIGSLVG